MANRRKVTPEAKIIALFTGLSEESQRMVMFGLNAITQAAQPQLPKPVTKKTKKVVPLLPDADEFGNPLGVA